MTCSGRGGGGDLQWDFVHGLFKNAIYGGRVDNSFDMKVLESYLRRYFNSNMASSGQLSDAIPPLPNSTNIKVFHKSVMNNNSLVNHGSAIHVLSLSNISVRLVNTDDFEFDQYVINDDIENFCRDNAS